MTQKTLLTTLALLVYSLSSFGQKFPGLAETPPMGWNSWNYFACDVSENLIKEAADAMVRSGMKDAGYVYINIDDCWHGERDSLGFIQPNPEHFPSGMKALADYIHSKGLKLGIYSDAGWKTCGGKPGSRGHEYQDAMKYAEWGIDYLKYDWCYTDGLKAEGAYLTMRDALYAAGRPIVLSICEWGNDEPWAWGPEIGHLWRTTGDIYHCFDCVIDHGTWNQWGVVQILDLRDNDLIRKSAGPGHWNDPDMMEVGNGMSVNEDRAHFSMWCMLAAPLIAGNDIRNMTPEVREILTNGEAIAIDQDPLGIQGFKYAVADSVDTWFKPLSNNEWALCFLNRATTPRNLSFNWTAEKVVDDLAKRSTDFDRIRYSVRDVWAHNDLGDTQKALNAMVAGHDVLMLRLTPVK
ncbi:MAG TPA: glycoside hydrolase family 27 protein [Prolixibacteraceae bacterium]|nr:glycoside hydrolase family 27 protein [Prolixibacteraceae bacterium]